MFLESLASSKPTELHVWQQSAGEALSSRSASNAAKSEVNNVAQAWKDDRLKHPGWLVTPAGIQAGLRYDTVPHYPNLTSLRQEQNVSTRMRLLFELACRHEIAFWPMHEEYVQATQALYSSGGEQHLTQKENTRICAFMYAESRRRWDWEAFEYWGSRLKSFEGHEALAQLIFGQALKAKQEFDFDTLSQLVGKLSGADPVWKMRQGMLYTFLYEDAKAAQCFQAALQEIRLRRTRDKQSIWLLSREAWASWIFQSARAQLPESKGKYFKEFGDWPATYSQKNCNPWDYLSFVDREAAEAFTKLQDDAKATTPLFDAGHYRKKSINFNFVNLPNVSALDMYSRLQETVGIPTRIGHTNLLATRLESAATQTSMAAEPGVFRAAALITNAEEKLMSTAFNRVEVAKIDLKTIVKLADCLRRASDFFLGKYTGEDRRLKSIDRVRRNIELISRLCVRMPAKDAKTYYRWALKLCKSEAANDWWLYKHIGNVLTRCLEAIPADERNELAETAIFLPLSGERNANGIDADWPELIDVFDQADFRRPAKNLKWAKRIEELVRAVRYGNPLDRDRAILRLRALFKAGLLETSEKEDLANAIWIKTNGEGGWPTSDSLYPFVFLELPEASPHQAKKLFLDRCVKGADAASLDVHFVRNLNGGLKTSRDVMEEARRNFPRILENFVSWKPRIIERDIVRRQVEQANEETSHAIEDFLANTLLPEMDAGEISVQAKNTWLGTLTNGQDHFIAATAFEYARLFPAEVDKIILVVRKALYSQRSRKLASGYHAISRFINAYENEGSNVPEIFISDVISACESMRTPGLHHAIHSAKRLVKTGLLSGEDKLRLAESVELIWSDFSYFEEAKDGERLITLTLVRSECAKLAQALLKSGQRTEAVDKICLEARDDPVPEVRHAI